MTLSSNFLLDQESLGLNRYPKFYREQGVFIENYLCAVIMESCPLPLDLVKLCLENLVERCPEIFQNGMLSCSDNEGNHHQKCNTRWIYLNSSMNRHQLDASDQQDICDEIRSFMAQMGCYRLVLQRHEYASWLLRLAEFKSIIK